MKTYETESKYTPAGTSCLAKSGLTVRKSALAIVAFCMLATILLIMIAPKPVMGFEGEPDGVYGIKWGTRFNDMPPKFKNALTVEVDRRGEGVMIYKLDPEVAKTPSNANEVGFVFLNNQFIATVMRLTNQEEAFEFIMVSIEVYGNPTAVMPLSGGSTTFWSGKVTTIVVTESPASNSVLIGNTSKMLEYGKTPGNRPKEKRPEKEEKRGGGLEV